MSKKRITRTEFIIDLDGKDYTVRPLSLEKARELTAQITEIENLPNDTDVKEIPGLLDKLSDVCFIILHRTNTDLTKEKVAKIITVEDIQTIMSIGLGGKLPAGTEVEDI